MESTPRIKTNRLAEKKKLMTRKSRHGFAKFMFIRQKHRLIRRWLLRNPWMRPMTVFNYAAVRIQAVGRSFITRNRIANPHSKSKNNNDSRRSSNKQLAKYLQTIEQYSKMRKIKPKWLEGGFSSWCAVRIQVRLTLLHTIQHLIFYTSIINQSYAVIYVICVITIYNIGMVQNVTILSTL